VFSLATFTHKADFLYATFTQDADFRSATFTQDAEFHYATFAHKADFSYATFTQGVYFGNATITDADFCCATFKQGVHSGWATFTQDADFSGAKCAQVAFFHNATFAQKADFSWATITDADFSCATFTQKAAFPCTTFMQDANFRDATFTQVADFRSAKFTHKADFSGATFTLNAYFRYATFTHKADFSCTTFTHKADFPCATFMQKADFLCATFTQDAYFGNATFMQVADFSKTTFALAAVFQEAKFAGPAGFRETKFRKDEELLAGPIFSLTEFSRPEAIVFYKTYLGQALFHNCDVSKLTFSSVQWRQRGQRGKRMVFDEEVSTEYRKSLVAGSTKDNADERDYGLIAEIYQQLKKNYDERKDYWTAGDFHYGEMEMKRLHSQSGNQLVRWLHRHFSLVALYKYASAYGESYVRPLILLLIVLAIFTSLFPLAGLNSGGDMQQSALIGATQQGSPLTTATKLSYRHFSDFVNAYPGRKWLGRAAFFFHSFMTAASVAGFQREIKYEPSSQKGRALALLEVLFTSTLIALFLLAIRRQFKR
jgi:uncharacterized protein YjbI with pentapeptide repeats